MNYKFIVPPKNEGTLIWNYSKGWGGNYYYCFSETNPGLLIENNLLEKVKIKVSSLVRNSKKEKLPKGKIYVSKWCNIPRYKIDEYIKENNITRVWSYKDADYVVMDKKEVEKIHSILNDNKKLFSYYSVLGAKLKKANSDLYEAMKEAHEKLGKGNVDTDEHIIISSVYNEYANKYVSVFSESEQLDLSNFKVKNWVYKRIYNNVGRIGLFDILVDYTENRNFELVFDTQLFELITSEGLVLDENMVENISNMFESRTLDNTLVALEMLSNCNFKENIYNLAVIFNKYNYYFHNRGVKKSEAFKILRDYLVEKNIPFSYKYQDFIKIMMERYPEGENVYKEYVKYKLNSWMKFANLGFKIKEME